MTALHEIPTLGVGIGFRPELQKLQSEHEDRIDWFELIADRYMRSVPESIERALAMGDRVPLIPHGLELSVGTDGPLDEAYCDEARELVHVLRAPFYSDHLCMTRAAGLEIGQLTPVPFTHRTAARCADKARRVQALIGVPLLLENVSYAFALPGEMTEAAFITEVLTLADCGLLLDLTNVFVNASNHRYDPFAYLDALPLDRVVQVHLAGGEKHHGRWIDTHSQRVDSNPQVWKLLEYLVSRTHVRAVLIERDQNFPSEFGEMLDDIERAREILRDGRREASPPGAGPPPEVRADGPGLAVDASVVQEALARVLVEPASRRAFVEDPARGGARLGLSAEQVAAFVDAGIELITAFAQDVAEKRISLLVKVCPATFRYMQQRGVLRQACARFAEEHVPRVAPEFANRTVRDGVWFLDLVDRMLAEGALDLPHLADVVRFERRQLHLASTWTLVESARAHHAVIDAHRGLAGAAFWSSRPVLGSHTAFEAFGCDVVRVIRRIMADEDPAEEVAGPMLVLFSKAPGWRNVRYVGTNERTRTLAEACDGSRTVREIAETVLGPARGPAWEARAQRLAAALGELSALNAVMFVPAPDAAA